MTYNTISLLNKVIISQLTKSNESHIHRKLIVFH